MGYPNFVRETPGPRHDGSPGETDPIKLARRQQQIDVGKKNPAYINYLSTIPKDTRYFTCPTTPDPYRKASRRCFDGSVRKWKIEVHQWSDKINEIKAANRFPSTMPTVGR